MIRILRPKGGRPKAGSVWGKCFVAAILALGFVQLGAGDASAQTRSLKLYNMHTREKAEIVFKRGGRYDQSGLRKLNQFLRDWRRNEPTKMDPRLFDLLWEAYKQAGARDYINVVCGYRSPSTNSMLRSRSKGVAKKSQHMLGKAMDFYIPGVKLKRLREIGLKMQGGGVGYYPSSGSPFVHFDVGNVRHWPKMSRRELIALFPNGKTLHVPSDGKPLPGFNQALASYQSRKKSGDIAIASAGSGSSGSSRSGGLLAAFFGGGGADEEEDTASTKVAMVETDRGSKTKIVVAKPKPETVAKVDDKAKADDKTKIDDKAKADNKIRIVSPDEADRVELPGVTAEPEQETPEQETIVAALPPRSAPVPGFAPRPQVDVGESTTAGIYGYGEPVTEATEVALNIPVPTPRPDSSPPAELAGDAVMIAAAGDVAVDVASGMPLPSERPGDAKADEIAPIIAAAPGTSPDEETDMGEDAYTVASLPETAPVALEAAFPTAPEEIIPDAKAAKGDMLSYAATPRTALVNRDPGTDPIAAVTPTVKTTPKAARPTAKSVKKAVKQPVVVAAQPADARWALDSTYVAENSSTTAPSFAHNLVRNAPSQVYTAGFQQSMQMADARRFTGKAVTFLSVAKFDSN